MVIILMMLRPSKPPQDQFGRVLEEVMRKRQLGRALQVPENVHMLQLHVMSGCQGHAFDSDTSPPVFARG